MLMTRIPMIAAAFLALSALALPTASAGTQNCNTSLLTPLGANCITTFDYSCPSGGFSCLVAVTCSIEGTGFVTCDPGTSDFYDEVCVGSTTGMSCTGYFRVSAGYRSSGGHICTFTGEAIDVRMHCDVEDR